MPIDWKELNALKSGIIFGITEALKRRTDRGRTSRKQQTRILPIGKMRA
jgi:hypothetical protein